MPVLLFFAFLQVGKWRRWSDMNIGPEHEEIFGTGYMTSKHTQIVCCLINQLVYLVEIPYVVFIIYVNEINHPFHKFSEYIVTH